MSEQQKHNDGGPAMPSVENKGTVMTPSPRLNLGLSFWDVAFLVAHHATKRNLTQMDVGVRQDLHIAAGAMGMGFQEFLVWTSANDADQMVAEREKRMNRK